jgi:uncharacterized protein YjdB
MLRRLLALESKWPLCRSGLRGTPAAATMLLTVLCAACNGGPTGNSSTPQVAILTTPFIEGGVFPGDTLKLVAQAYTAGGGVNNAAITWASTNPAVATVSNVGLVTAVSGGTTAITASANGASDSKVLVVDGNVTASVGIAPATATTKVGTPFQFLALIKTTQGNPHRGGGAIWTSGDATKATVDATGKATTLAVTSGVPICVTAPDNAAIKTCGTLTITP